jgi:hypothetical protein
MTRYLGRWRVSGPPIPVGAREGAALRSPVTPPARQPLAASLFGDNDSACSETVTSGRCSVSAASASATRPAMTEAGSDPPPPDEPLALTDEEKRALVQLLRRALDFDPYP